MPISIGLVEGVIRLRDEFTSQLNASASALEKHGKRMKKVGEELSDVGGKLTTSLTLPILALGGLATKAATDFESSFAGVRKTVDATEAEFAELAAGMRGMAKEIPVNVNELNAIGEAAGQLGIKTTAIMGFTRVVADLGVTTNLSADAAATSLARLANITGLPQEQFDRLGSTIVALGNTFATTEAEVVEFGLRMAGAGTIAGLTEAEILGIGAAMSSVGVEAEAGGTAVQKVLLGMTQAVAQGNADLAVFASTAGMSAQQFADAWRANAGAAFTAFVEGLGAQGDAAFQTLEQLNLQDQRLIRSFLSLAGAGDLLARTLAEGNTAFAENTALAKEAQQRYDTFSSRLKVFLGELRDVAITLGTALIPVFRDMLAAARPVVAVLADAAEAFARLPQPVQAAVVALAGIAAAAGPVLFVVGQLTAAYGSVIAMFPKVAAVFALAGKGIAASAAALTGPVGWIAAGAALLLMIRPVREAVLDLGGRAISALRAGVSAVIGQFREWWEASAEVRRVVGLVARQLVVDLGTALRAVAGALQAAWDWLVKVARITAEVARVTAGAIVYLLEVLGVLGPLVTAWDAMSEATKRAVGWLEKASGLAGKEGLARLLVVLNLINPAFAQVAAGAIAYTDRAIELQEQQDRLVKVASEVVSETENITLTTEEMDRALRQAAGGSGGVSALSEEAQTLADRWRVAAEQSGRLVAAIERGGRPAFEALQRQIAAENEVVAVGVKLHSDFGRELVALGVAAAETEVEVGRAVGAMDERLQELIGTVERLRTVDVGLKIEELRVARIEAEVKTVVDQQSLRNTLHEIDEALSEAGGSGDWLGPRAEEVRNRLLEIGRLRVEAEESAARAIEAIQERAWGNVLDIAQDTIATMLKTGEVDFQSLADSILDIFANMLAELLVQWAANAAKRIALEQAVAAAGGASGAGGAAGGAATSGAAAYGAGQVSTSAIMAAIPFVALGAIVLGIGVAMGWWGSTGPTTGQVTIGSGAGGEGLGIKGSTGENAGVITKHLREAFKRIEDFLVDIELEIDRFNDVIVEKVGQTYMITGNSLILLKNKTSQEIDEAITVMSIRTADFGDSVSEFLQAIIRGSRAITEEQLKAEIALGRMVDSFGKSDFEQEIARLGFEMNAIFDQLARLLSENVEQLGVGLTSTITEELARWHSAFRSLTGQEMTDQERLDLLKANAAIFEAEKALRILDLQDRLAALKAKKGLEEFKNKLDIHELEFDRDIFRAHAGLLAASVQTTTAIVEAGATALDLQIQAIEDLIAGLKAIPAIDIPNLKLPEVGGGGGIDQVAQDMERLRDMLDAAAMLQLPEFEAALAAINEKWNEAVELAHGNADLIAEITAAREAEIAALERQRLLDFTGALDDFLGGGGSGSSFVDSVNAVDQRVNELGADLGQLAEDLGLTAFEMLHFWQQVLAGAEKMKKALATEGFLGLARGLADLTQDEQLRHDLLKQIATVEFDLRMALFQMEFEMLKALGYLTAEQMALIEATLADVAKNRDLIIRSQVPIPGFGGGGGGSDPADARARALQRLREIQARALDPFSQAIRSVVDEFAELRRVLGWTAEVQAAYAAEIQRVLMEQLEPIRRMQEELAFQAGSPMRSIDQFRLAQQNLNEAVAALRAGDLAALAEIPNLAQLVLDLNPSSQASEATRFLFAQINRILDEAAAAAESAVAGIEPGTASDPFAWLRDEPTAGDELIAQTIRDIGRDLGDKQDETTGNTGDTRDRLPDPPFDWRDVGVRPGPAPDPNDPEAGARRVAAEAREIESLQRLREIAARQASIDNTLKSGSFGVRAVG